MLCFQGFTVSTARDTGYLAYVVDTRVGKEVLVLDAHVVREFANVFSKELPGVPPESQVEFRFNMVLGAAPIAKASYRLAPPKMQELFSQL